MSNLFVTANSGTDTWASSVGDLMAFVTAGGSASLSSWCQATLDADAVEFVDAWTYGQMGGFLTAGRTAAAFTFGDGALTIIAGEDGYAESIGNMIVGITAGGFGGAFSYGALAGNLTTGGVQS